VVPRHPDREVATQGSLVAVVVVALHINPRFLSTTVLATKPQEERWAGNTRSVSYMPALFQHERYGKHDHNTLSLPQQLISRSPENLLA
jgi:hypothetical protein